MEFLPMMADTSKRKYIQCNMHKHPKAVVMSPHLTPDVSPIMMHPLSALRALCRSPSQQQHSRHH